MNIHGDVVTNKMTHADSKVDGWRLMVRNGF